MLDNVQTAIQLPCPILYSCLIGIRTSHILPATSSNFFLSVVLVSSIKTIEFIKLNCIPYETSLDYYPARTDLSINIVAKGRPQASIEDCSHSRKPGRTARSPGRIQAV